MVGDYLLVENLLEDDFDWNHVLNVVLNEVGEIMLPNYNGVRPRNAPIYNENYFENIVPQYTVTDFRSHFRMTKNSVQYLCELVAPFIQERHLYIDLEKKICFFIWILGKQESFLATSDRFGFGKGTGYYVFKTILRAIILLKEEFIKWPTEAERRQIATRIENKTRVPGVIGAIDGSHITIKQPTHNAVDYYNRKEQHSIILQAVCDDNRMITDIFVGMPGRLHDARVFRNSPLYERLVGLPPLLPPEQHLLGDAAYPLMQNLMKPFRDNGHLTPAQHRFNTVISGQRSVIERAFALLKGKWRRLKFLDMSLAHMIPEIVTVACILHNFVLTFEKNEDYMEDILPQVAEDEGNELNNAADNDAHSAMLKRNYIMSLL